MRKIKNNKREKTKLKSEEINRQMESGFNFIKNICPKDIYEKFYLLHLDTSPVIIDAILLLKKSYDIQKNNRGLTNDNTNKLRESITLFVNKYIEEYIPTRQMGLYSLFFLMNKWIEKYVKINEYKKLFKKENNNKNIFTEIYTKEKYSEFNKIFKFESLNNYIIDPAYDYKWEMDFKHISELIKNNLVILDGYREKIYNNKNLRSFYKKYYNSASIKQIYIPEECKDWFEYKFITELEKLFSLAIELLNSKELITSMRVIKTNKEDEFKKDIEYITFSIKEMDNFFNRFMYLLITGETINDPKLVKQKLKELKQKNKNK